ncbi:peptide chain release factor N(5)-glutamine methyltransferase [Winogradskyella luteola]|uniref:Release factor glutamine methyltransferase n=1 Tax=Winogradskyella luteola TaxID=2828330 RepID=A0A9X1FAC4_9FLAO|nr:peptide chain release factor N(5)-glutamine methyltransferase [Winogradskyella luteola]MBV7270222.1 peptide chain release factor N(5)-glutamine methyltransferase [Winogradskyella luteola]
MKAKDLKHIFHKELDAIYGENEVESFFFLCAEYYFDFARIQLALEPEFTFVKSEADTFFEVLEKLKKEIPIQYILGETEFYGLKFRVNENALIPRPETEELVDWIVNCHLERSEESKLKILDIGTGSGCIAVALAKHLPNAELYAIDVSKDALQVAKQNAELNKVNITFIEANILRPTYRSTLDTESNFDVIVSNPPYVRHLEKAEIRSNVIDNEPHLALFVEDDNPLVFYKSIMDFAVDNLKQKGQLYFEINQYLGNETKRLLLNANFEGVELRKDLNGNDRMLKGIKK